MQEETVKVESKIIKEEVAYEGKWIGLKYVTFSVGEKVIPNYEAVYRTTRKNNVHIDGVEIVPVIKYKDRPSEIVMIANFRPPIGKFSLEFPSGLVENENFEENAKRQMLEETGYVISRFIDIPYPVMYADPWKSNECGLLYIGIIDGDDPNSLQKQQLEETQNIRVHKLTLDDDLPRKVNELIEKNNYGVEDKVWSLCIGMLITGFMK